MNRKIKIIVDKLESFQYGSNFLISKQNEDLLNQIASLIAINESKRLGLSEIKKIGKESTRGAYKTKNKNETDKIQRGEHRACKRPARIQ